MNLLMKTELHTKYLVVFLQMKDSVLVPINDEKVVMTAYWKLTLSFYYIVPTYAMTFPIACKV